VDVQIRPSGDEDARAARVATVTEADARADPVTEVATVDPRAEQFLVAFETLAQAVRRARGAVAQDPPERLTLSQYALLTSLAGGTDARVSDLASEAGIAPSTASRILDALERRDVVRRTRSPDDRRGVVVSLTDAGREALRRQDAWMRARQMTFFGDLTEAERDVVSDLLVRLADLIEELSTGPAG
jgi:DNA-binding MarR family transcriptional regulator